MLNAAVLLLWLDGVTLGVADTLPAPGVVEGRVLAPPGRPVAHATIDDSSVNRSTVSDADGYFRIVGLPPGPHHLVIRAVGFIPVARRLELSPSSGWRRFDDFFRRRRIGFGRFLDREAIQRANASSLFQLLQGIPGINVTWNPPGSERPATIRMARCPGQPPRMALYINGQRIRWDMGLSKTAEGVSFGGGDPETRRKAQEAFAEAMNSIVPIEIEMMEVYRGVSELPSDLPDRDVCAAVVVYTRWYGEDG